MKTKSNTFLGAFKSIVFNQRGSVGEEAEAVEVAPEAQEEIQEESEEVEQVEAAAEEVAEVQAETEEELEEEIKEAIDEGASNEEIKDMIRQFTLKVDGKEFIKEIDLNNEEELTKQFQLAAKGQKSMQEVQELKKMYASQLDKLLDDPFGELKKLKEDFDPLEVSARYIDQLTKESEMSPEEKAQLESQRQFEEVKAERDRLKAEAQERENEVQRRAIAEEIQTDIMSALEDDSDLVADRETVALVAENLMWAARNNMNDITAKDVIPTVKAQLKENFQRAASRFKSTDSLKSHIGDDIINKLREERVAQVQNQIKNTASLKQDVTKPKKTEEKREKAKLSDLFR